MFDKIKALIAEKQQARRRGFVGIIIALFGLFIIAILGMALAPPFAQQVGVTLNDSNVARAPGAGAILQMNITLFVGIISVLLLGGMATFAYVKKG